MITIKLDGLDKIKAALRFAPKRVEIAVQRSMLKTAHHIREAEQSEMRRVFDRPTRWTLGAIKVKPTAKMEVTVGIIDPGGYYRRAQSYLGTQVTGGSRRLKAMEIALQQRGIMPVGWHIVPGAGAKMDAYGNMGVGQIRQILSWFDAAERWAGSTQNMGEAGRARRRKGTRKNVGFEYFAVSPTRPSRGYNLKPGIYQRFFFGIGKSIKPVMIFVPTASYRQRFDFERVARNTFAKRWSAEIDVAIKRELDALK